MTTTAVERKPNHAQDPTAIRQHLVAALRADLVGPFAGQNA